MTHKRNKLQLGLSRTPYSYPPRERGPGDEAIMIHTGLSVTVVGCLCDVVRDEVHHVATVRVAPLPGHTASGTPYEASVVAQAAVLLADRAQRFLGHGWRVIRWQAPKPAPMAGA